MFEKFIFLMNFQLETALQQERNNHNKEMQELKEKFTDNFLMVCVIFSLIKFGIQ